MSLDVEIFSPMDGGSGTYSSIQYAHVMRSSIVQCLLVARNISVAAKGDIFEKLDLKRCLKGR